MQKFEMMEINDYDILYVDDEQANLNSLKSLFRRKFKIITAKTGQKGLEILEDRPVQIIIADQRMPNMTGVEFLKIVKKKWPNIKCILLTGFADNKVIKEVINDIGIYWYMNKPFDNEKLELVIRKGLELFATEELIKKSEEKLRGVFESFADVFVRRNFKEEIVLVSPSIFNLTGYTVDEIIKKRVNSYLVDPNTPNRITQNLLKDGGVQTFESEIIKKDGSLITTSSNSKLYYDDLGNPQGVESVIRDITEKKIADKIILESQEKLKNLAHQLTIAEEKMRKQMAADLHDDVGQLLSSSRMQLAAIDFDGDPKLIEKKIKNISQVLLLATKATRELIFNLSPPQLNEIGLYAAIHDWMKEEIEKKYNIRTSITGDKAIYDLDENTRFLLFRSIKELLNNIIKHARASLVNITLSYSDKLLVIVVKDNGIGFESDTYNSQLPNMGFGLFSIQERVSNLGGSITIDSKLNFGTEIKLIIPRE